MSVLVVKRHGKFICGRNKLTQTVDGLNFVYVWQYRIIITKLVRIVQINKIQEA